MPSPAQGPITLYAPKPVSVKMFPPSGRRFNFRSKLKTLLSVLIVSGFVIGFYPFAGYVWGVLTQGGSALTLDLVLDEDFNLSLAGKLEGSQLIATTSDSDPLIVNSTSLVDNLNADLLDGQHGSYYVDSIAAATNSSGWVDDGTEVRLRTVTDRVGIGITNPDSTSTLNVFKSDNTGTQTLLRGVLGDLFLYADDNVPGTNIYNAVQGRSRYYGTAGETAYSVRGLSGTMLNMSSGDVTEADGVNGQVGNSGTGTIDRAIALYAQGVINFSTGTINTAYGLLVGGASNPGGGTLSNNYGVFIGNPACVGCDNPWALYSEAGKNYFGGEVGIGTSDLAGVGVATIDGLVRMRNDGDSRYRSDWVVNTDGLSVNSYDDTDSVYLPIRFDGYSFALRADGDDAKSITLDNSGAVGIGTVSPGATLDVRGSAVFNEDGDDNDFRVEGATVANLFLVNAGLDSIQIGTFAGIADFSAAQIIFGQGAGVESPAVDFTVAGELNADLFQIDADTNTVLIDGGNTASFSATGIVFNDVSSADIDIRFEGGTDANLLFLDAGLDLVGIGRVPTTNKLEVEGDASKSVAGDWLANSDIRIKTDVHTVKDALEVIGQLRPVKFKYTDEYLAAHPEIKDQYYYNFIAQEFQEVFPDAVKQGGDGYLQVDAYVVRPYLVAAVQELAGKVQDLEAAIDSSGSLTSSGEIVIPAKLETEEGVFEKLVSTVLGTFEKLIAQTAEIASAVIENLKVKFLTVGESAAPTGITIYDRATGEPYCVAVNEGTVVTEAGICE